MSRRERGERERGQRNINGRKKGDEEKREGKR